MSKTILSYQGPLTFSTIDWLLTRFKYVAEEYDITFRLYKKLLSVMIEALENVTKYSDQFDCDQGSKNESCPTFLLNRNDNCFELITSNPVKNKHVEPLRARIEKVNNKSRDELKELYKSTITNGKFTSKGGAGLGFIEMAKTSGNNLDYIFSKGSKGYSIYTFKVSFDL
jgi:hypothetical protein